MLASVWYNLITFNSLTKVHETINFNIKDVNLPKIFQLRLSSIASALIMLKSQIISYQLLVFSLHIQQIPKIISPRTSNKLTNVIINYFCKAEKNIL